MVRLSRKGSMQLSIEAIIVLVIAMVLLGLGIAFIQGFFKTGTEKLNEPFSDLQFGCNPTQQDPVKTSPTEISLKSGDEMKLRLCFYAPSEVYKASMTFDGCVCTSNDCADKQPRLVAKDLPHVARTETGKFDTFLIAQDEESGDPLPPASYICSVSISGASASTGTPAQLNTAQVTITVT